ncbi:HNH endonuclease [Streptosporangium sp. NPDC050855]|uniref:HNH endonuclease n=1 Tax=Streptosporangium sp. NPDC050855 TaxID=3366194 RepID=UPI00379334C3
MAYQRQRKEETGRWPSHDVIYERTCEGCGSAWRTRQRLAKYCSRPCANKTRAYSLSCDHCQAAFTSSSTRTRWCSTACTAQWREAKEQERRRTAWLPAPLDWPHGRAWTRLPDRHPARQHIPKPRVFVQGDCIRCGTSFCVQATGPASYCSAKCAKADQRARRRAVQKNAYVAHVYRSRIFERDDWTCQLCHTKTDRDQVVPHPKAPVIDHIVPLAKGGTHEPANTQCAHFMCNSIKSDREAMKRLLATL